MKIFISKKIRNPIKNMKVELMKLTAKSLNEGKN